MIDLTVVGPSEYKQWLSKGSFVVSYGHYDSIFGTCLIGLAKNKICHLSFVEKEDSKNLSALHEQWRGAIFEKDEKKTFLVTQEIFDDGNKPLSVLAKGTKFQEDVWRGLLEIPEGKTWSYEELASKIGRPKAIRASAKAVATNPIAFLIPCHRVIKKSGEVHRYRWGCKIKEKILNWEKKKLDACS